MILPTANSFLAIVVCLFLVTHLLGDIGAQPVSAGESSPPLPVTTPKIPFPPLPVPTLASNDSHLQLHRPFTLTCNLEKLKNLHHSKYSVAFYSSRDGQLAVFDVDGKNFKGILKLT